MKKTFVLLCLHLFVLSCSNRSKKNEPELSGKSTLVVSFNPAFQENSTVLVYKDGDSLQLSILLRCNENTRSPGDTFFYKAKKLSTKEFLYIDSTIIKMMNLPIVPKTNNGNDGITIDFKFTQNADSIVKHFWSPSKDYDPIGFLITSKAIKTFKVLFDDRIVSEYFDDVTEYMSDTQHIPASKNSAIYKLREKKYGR